ncbi:MAG: hypothetical protein [Bacteriophage sp.]|nr:MAG: hypothetical protein [Bacteriophage sp.]
MEITFKTNPHKAVSFVESSVKKALDACGHLIADIKYDGVRGNIVVDNTADSLWLSRVSKTIPALEHLNGFDARWSKVMYDDRWIFPDGFMLDGELMVKGVDFNTGSGLLRTKWTKPDNVKYHEDYENLKDLRLTKSQLAKTPFKLNSKHLKVVLYAAMPYHDMVDGKEYPVMNLLMRMHMEAVLPVLKEHFPDGFMLDGELMVKGVDFNTGSGLLRTKWTKPDNVKYHEDYENLKDLRLTKSQLAKTPFKLNSKHLKVVLYAAMPYHDMVDGKEYPVMNLLMRMHMEAVLPVLKEHFPEIGWELSESHEVTDMVELSALYEKARSDGHEGLIVKDPFGYYQRGKKSGFWKMKPECEADGVIVGLKWGTQGLANEGKVIGFEVLLETGRVVAATNLTQELMDEFTATVRNARCLETAFDGKPGEYYHGWACQVNYMEETPDGSLRHPTFAMFRGTEDNPKEKM